MNPHVPLRKPPPGDRTDAFGDRTRPRVQRGTSPPHARNNSRRSRHFSPRKFPALTLIALALATILPTPSIRADGGIVIAAQTIGPQRITVFADPAVLRAGYADFSILVQNTETNEAILDAQVEFSLTPLASDSPETAQVAWVPPCCSMGPRQDITRIPANRAHSTNKLLHAADILLPASGRYELTATIITAAGTAVLPTTLTVAPPPSPLSSYWPFLALPPLLILGFSLHQKIRKERS